MIFSTIRESGCVSFLLSIVANESTAVAETEENIHPFMSL